MKLHTIQYLFKEGIVGLWKNRLMAFASAATIVLCLLILGMSYAIAQNVGYMMEQVETELGIVAYINDDALLDDIDTLVRQVDSIPHVLEVIYVSKEEALKNFASIQENDELFDTFLFDNPLPASLEIKVNDLTMQEGVVEALNMIPSLQVEYFEAESNMLIEITQSIQVVSVIIIGCLVVIALLLITNTIELTVYVRRKEINIMKYIGATDTFIRLPFLIEGILIGIIGSLIPTWLIYVSYNWFNEFMRGVLGTILGGIALQPVEVILTGLIPIFLVLGVGIGAAGSSIAIRRHLRV